MEWSAERIIVTGGAGFLGLRIVATLYARGAKDIFIPRSADIDLRQREQVSQYLDRVQPTLIIHAAAVVGGIGANRARPADFFYDNLLMGAHLIHYAQAVGVRKCVTIGTVCAYPKVTPVPFSEDDLWNGYPEETNAPYGVAKRALLTMGQAYRQQYDLNAIYLLPTNLYGEGDNFDPQTSHVIPALIHKFTHAVDHGEQTVTVWGSGTATREFLHVEDAAEGIVLAAERYDRPDPVNLGSGESVPIRRLAEMIAHLTGFEGAIRYDPSQPDGQLRRAVDTRRAYRAFGFTPRLSLGEGLARVVAWYRRETLPTP